MKRWMLIGVILVLTTGIFVIMLFNFANRQKVFSQQDPYRDYDRARAMIQENRDDEAIILLNQIIQTNPGAPVIVLCRFQLAELYGYIKKDVTKMLQEYQAVIDQFPGTSYEFQAKACMIFCNYLKHNTRQDYDTWLKKIDELLVEHGGISVNNILRENVINNDKLRTKLKTLPQEYRACVFPQQYHEIACRFYDYKNVGVHKNGDAIKMDIFVRSFFPKFEQNDSIIHNIKTTLINDKHIDNSKFSKDTIPPIIKVIEPDEGDIVRHEHLKIEAELSDGDISQSQISLPKLVFTLDGQDLTETMIVKCSINEDNDGHGHRCESPSSVFEKARIEYSPLQPLADGGHTIYIKAIDIAGNISEKTWHFTTKKVCH